MGEREEMGGEGGVPGGDLVAGVILLQATTQFCACSLFMYSKEVPKKTEHRHMTVKLVFVLCSFTFTHIFLV